MSHLQNILSDLNKRLNSALFDGDYYRKMQNQNELLIIALKEQIAELERINDK
jgi:hypothetical protein